MLFSPLLPDSRLILSPKLMLSCPEKHYPSGIEWAREMTFALRDAGLMSYVNGTIRKPVLDGTLDNFELIAMKEAIVTWIQKDDRAVGKLGKMCFKPIQLGFKDHWSAKEAWKFLKEQYTSVGWSSKWAVLNRLEEAHYETSNGIADLESSINVVLEDIEEQNITMKEYVTIKVINFLGPGFETYVIVLNEQARKENKLPDLGGLFKSLKEEELRMKDYERLHAIHGPRRGRSNARVTCPHCKKTGHTEEGCWPLHPELAPKHLQEKFRNELEAQKGRDSSTRIGSMTAGVRRTFIG